MPNLKGRLAAAFLRGLATGLGAGRSLVGSLDSLTGASPSVDRVVERLLAERGEGTERLRLLTGPVLDQWEGRCLADCRTGPAAAAVLRGLVEEREARSRRARSVLSALAYPALLVVGGTLLTGVPVLILGGLSDFLAAVMPPIILATVIGALLAVVVVAVVGARLPGGLQAVVEGAPVLGAWARSRDLVLWARVAGGLSKALVPPVTGFGIAAHLVRDRSLASRLRLATQDRDLGYLPVDLALAIRAGRDAPGLEHLGDALMTWADQEDRRLEAVERAVVRVATITLLVVVSLIALVQIASHPISTPGLLQDVDIPPELLDVLQ